MLYVWRIIMNKKQLLFIVSLYSGVTQLEALQFVNKLRPVTRIIFAPAMRGKSTLPRLGIVVQPEAQILQVEPDTYTLEAYSESNPITNSQQSPSTALALLPEDEEKYDRITQIREFHPEKSHYNLESLLETRRILGLLQLEDAYKTILQKEKEAKEAQRIKDEYEKKQQEAVYRSHGFTIKPDDNTTIPTKNKQQLIEEFRRKQAQKALASRQ